MKFILFVEGETEYKVLPLFLKRWLDPQVNRSVGIAPVNLAGSSNFEAEIAQKARMYLNGAKRNEIIAAIGLADLYGFTSYPPHLHDMRGRYDWAKQKLQNKVGHSKFRQFFAVHELEAWLLSDSKIFPSQIKNAIYKAASNPEAVNFNQPPAVLLKKLYREKLVNTEYNKVAYGVDLFKKLDPTIAYQKCPHLQEMLDEMLRLAKDSGN